MPTETELVNSALRKGGAAKRIMALTDAIGTAGIASDVLAQERDDLLRAGVWNFSITRIKLGQLATLPVFGWAFAYAMPSDCMRVVSVHNNTAGTGTVPYKLESIQQVDTTYINVLCSDASDIYLRYCRQVTDPNLMTTSFRQVLILRLAKIFAIAIAKSNPLYQGLAAEEKSAFTSAKAIDGIEDFPERVPEGSWASSRRGRGSRDGSGWSR